MGVATTTVVVVAEGGLGDGRVAMVVEGACCEGVLVGACCEGVLVEGAGACDGCGGGVVLVLLVTGSSPEPSADPSAPASLSGLVITHSSSRGISLVATAGREAEVWHRLSFSVNH